MIGQTAQNVTFELAFWFFAFSFRFFPRNGYLIVTCDRNVENVGHEKKRENHNRATFIGFDLRAKMAGMITVSFEGKRVGLSREDLNISELERIYQLDSPGAHLKIKSGAGFQNIWPDRAGKFVVPPNCFSAIVVAMPQRQENEQENACIPDYTGGIGRGGNQRGNSAATFFRPGSFNERFEPSGSVSSLHVMSRGRSRFFPQSGIAGMGSRPVPAVWGAKGKKRKSTESKSFRLTFVDGDGNFEDMWEIPIDLGQLQDMHGQYTVLHVVGEIERQLNEEDTRLVVTDIKGKPIRDMASTRGEIFVSRFHQLDCK